MKLHHLFIAFGSVLLILGLLVINGGIPEPPPEAAITAVSTDTVATTPSPNTINEQTSMAQPTPTGASMYVSIPLENVMWHDSFENRDSGWEPYYNVTKAKNYMGKYESLTDSRLYAWNGYQDNSYQIHLPGRKKLSSVMPYLWDFNTRYSLPAYPYRVRADVSVDPAGNAMLIVDFSGDFNHIEQGDGITLVWGHSDALSYKYVDTWTLTVYEFHQGRTWALACTNGNLSEIKQPQSSAVVDVDLYTVRVTLYSATGMNYQAQCDRVQPGQPYNPRYLGIGAVYPQPMIPVNDYNMVAFQDIYVMAGSPLATQSNAPAKFITSACNGAWMGGWDYEIALPVTEILESDTFCRNEYGNFSSDFPGYGPERIAMPDDKLNGSNWECGGNANSSRFQIWQENDYLRLSMDNTTFYVFYAKEIYEHIRSYAYNSDPVPYGYIVTETAYGGNRTTFNSVDFVRVGDGIGVSDQYRFFFTVRDANTLITNWTVAPCVRIQ